MLHHKDFPAEIGGKHESRDVDFHCCCGCGDNHSSYFVAPQ